MAKPLKQSVKLDQPVRVSRIRRDPVPINHRGTEEEKKVKWRTSEREIWLAILGIVAFALAIDIITVAVSAYSGSSGEQSPAAHIVISDKS